MKDSSEGSGADCERPSTEKIKPIGRIELRVIRWFCTITASAMILSSVTHYFRAYPVMVKRFEQMATPREAEAFRGLLAAQMFMIIPLSALIIILLVWNLGRPVKPDLADQLERK